MKPENFLPVLIYTIIKDEFYNNENRNIKKIENKFVEILAKSKC